MSDRASDRVDCLVLDHYLRDIDTGKSPTAENTPAGDGEWGVLKVSAVQEGWFQSHENKVIRDAAHIHPRFEVRPGDLLMTRANTEDLVGLACIAATPSPRLMLSDKTLRLVVDEEVADPAFVALALLRPSARGQVRAMATGTSAGMKNISQRQIRNLKVPRASLEEQRRIVAVHAAFERRIGGLERELDKLDHLRRGLRDGVVSGPLTRLGEVLAEKPKNGYSPSEVREWTGLLALGLGCLTSEGFVPKQLKRIPDSPMAHRFRLVDGDLLMSRANTRELVGLAGRYQDVGQSCIYPDLMMRLRPDEQRCLSAYLEMALASSSVRAAVQAEARGTSESMVKISAGVVEALSIPLPSLERQREAVEAAELLDSRIVKQQAVVAKLRTVQRGVCEDLLRG
ncbi:hypothetical protein OHA98_08975 [Streptomyces sp. NBC_00654]|uniref:restriction endonuclease subunit S n=1 Tax=Streptomyces sp. NBC_00654 TaxID=2975799 RepID=UPI0022561C77|nr:hypothetical protein [Streptomyces sp. NBC_00654]MCX4964962.1 hypothetical protein [Streptomyces sp. NBC_00654]